MYCISKNVQTGCLHKDLYFIIIISLNTNNSYCQEERTLDINKSNWKQDIEPNEEILNNEDILLQHPNKTGEYTTKKLLNKGLKLKIYSKQCIFHCFQSEENKI